MSSTGKERKESGASSRKLSSVKSERRASGSKSERKVSGAGKAPGNANDPKQLDGAAGNLPLTATDADPEASETADMFGPEFQEPEIRRLFTYIDGQRSTFIEVLREAVGIRSVSAWPEARAEVMRMVQWTGELLN